MRDLKFKAPVYSVNPRVDNKQKIVKWVTFNLQSFDADWNMSEPFIIDLETGEEVPGYLVDTEKARLYTGLKDKDGHEIYEGDILKWYEIGSHYMTAAVSWENDRSGWFPINSWRPSQPEVIGNIYEHPHLLEKHDA